MFHRVNANSTHADAPQRHCQSSRRARLSANQGCSSRSLVSIESIESIWSLDDSDCSDNENDRNRSEHPVVAIAVDRSHRETAEVCLTERQSTALIQGTWNQLLQNQGNDKKAVGEQIVRYMLNIKPSCSTSLGISSSSSEQTPRFAELGDKVGYVLDRLVLNMGLDLWDEELTEEWIEEGLDALLVHRAVIRCLEGSLDSDVYSYEAAEAWSTAFKDTLQKVLMF